ncbi:NADP-dependent oxidoreductase [Parasphingorhabdus halotolerans]|uniref:NADP-dependent oxidoreductase n=1 Tax=Parasphingorhabdus halotolerans TaxID=2725558 RepID=A0A6H2DMH6_9SPHN|nr:NADP-dependent oxidoreductase [Parasphingorhabdus halotolerans]QJB69554.1 NADP-dependent oxidoreductase [Parasphingorhabdus halotolerans]
MTTRQIWQLESRPEGNDFVSAIRLVEEQIPPLADGEVLVKNIYLSMDAGTRMWMTAREDGYNPPLPLGSPITGLTMGYVAASNAAGFAEGDLVRGFGQWSDQSVVHAELGGLFKLDDSVEDIRQHFGVLGMNGWTALWGLIETAKIQPGENVLVSAAAGSTGMLACQIAKILGCNVYGLAGGAEKCRWLEDEIGITKAIDYKTADIGAELGQIQDGINAYFDNVAGPILDAVLPNMALYGRIALCGLMAQYSGDGRARGPEHFDQILMKRLSVIGFFSPDFMDQGERLTAQLKTWLDDSKLQMPFDVTEGLENTLDAYERLFTGANIGKVLVKL